LRTRAREFWRKRWCCLRKLQYLNVCELRKRWCGGFDKVCALMSQSLRKKRALLIVEAMRTPPSAQTTTSEDEYYHRLHCHLMAHHVGDFAASAAVTIFRETKTERELAQA
jgi:hypothetical protein